MAVVIFQPDAPLELVIPVLSKATPKLTPEIPYIKTLAKQELERLRKAYGVPLSFTEDTRIPADILAKMRELERVCYA